MSIERWVNDSDSNAKVFKENPVLMILFPKIPRARGWDRSCALHGWDPSNRCVFIRFPLFISPTKQQATVRLLW